MASRAAGTLPLTHHHSTRLIISRAGRKSKKYYAEFGQHGTTHISLKLAGRSLVKIIESLHFKKSLLQQVTQALRPIVFPESCDAKHAMVGMNRVCKSYA